MKISQHHLTLAAVFGLLLSSAQAAGAESVATIYAPGNLSQPMASASEANSGLEFSYPKSWSRVPDSDQNTLLKISGAADGHFGEFKIGSLKDLTDITAAKHLMQAGFAQASSESKKLNERSVKFGSRTQFNGSEMRLSFKIGDALYCTRIIFLLINGKVITLSFTCLDSEYSAMRPTFDQILASIRKVQGANNKSQASLTTRANTGLTQWKFERYSDKSGTVSINYPADWKIAPADLGKPNEVKFSGTNNQQLGAELILAKIERNPALSMEQFMDSYETNCLKPLNGFRKTSTNNTRFGISQTEGVIQYYTFSTDGHPARQSTAFFADSRNYYCVALTAALWSELEQRELFNRILTSVKVTE